MGSDGLVGKGFVGDDRIMGDGGMMGGGGDEGIVSGKVAVGGDTLGSYYSLRTYRSGTLWSPHQQTSKPIESISITSTSGSTGPIDFLLASRSTQSPESTFM